MDEDDIYIRPQPKRSFQVEMHKMGTHDELRALREERDALTRERDGLRLVLSAIGGEARGAALLQAARAVLNVSGWLTGDRPTYTIWGNDGQAIRHAADALRAAGFTDQETTR